MPEPVSHTQRIRLFKNEHLEKLTLISPRVFAAVWGILLPLIAWTGWTHTAAAALSGDQKMVHFGWVILGLVALGVAFWTLFEYAMHRFLVHWETDIPPARWLVYLVHGNHHESPNDPLRGLMPFSVSLPVGALIWLACVSAMGAMGTWPFLGFMIGYVMYDTVHFACHQWPMRGSLGLMFKRHHMRHHHINEHANYAISALFWDRVFGTRIVSLRQEETKE
jgi:sterol desaturase/sphingolipid hydroxylase (fatty acid hydroxylase superfamily)